MITLSKT